MTMLQVIKAEDVRDGEPRWYCGGDSDGTYEREAVEIRRFMLHTHSLDDLCIEAKLAIVDRPAPTTAPAYCSHHHHAKWCEHNGGVMGATGWEDPAPGLDLEAIERAEPLTGEQMASWRAATDAATPLVAEVRTLRDEVARLRADRAEFKAWWDLTTKERDEARARLAESTAAAVALAAEADGLRVEVARLTAEADETNRILEESVAEWERRVACASNICAHCKEPHTDAEMSAHVAACPRSPIVAKLAEAKRLGMEAIEVIDEAIDSPLDASAMASIGARQAVIAAALEAL